MKIKLNRGPMKNQYLEVPATQSILNYAEPIKFDFKQVSEELLSVAPSVRIGVYQRSYTTLKNGAVVFEWMGWKNEG